MSSTTLRTLVRRPRTQSALTSRCRVVLLDDQGLAYAAIGAKIDMREQTVLKWRSRFLKHRTEIFKLSTDPNCVEKMLILWVCV